MELKPGFKSTPLGLFPELWDVVPLGSLSEFITSGSRGWAQFYAEKGAVFIRSQNIRKGALDFSDSQCVMPPQGAEGSRTKVVFGDVLITITGNSVGNVASVDRELGEAYISQHVGLVRLKAPSSAPYVSVFLSAGAPGNEQIAGSQSGQSKPGLNLRNLHEFWVALPPMVERHGIAASLSDVDALIAGLERLINKKRDIKQAAMQQLLTGQTRLPGFSGEWEVKRLGDLADLIRQTVIPASQPDQSFMHFSLPAFDMGKSASLELGCTIGSNKFCVPSNAVLLSKLNPRIPRVWAPDEVPNNACASTEWLVLTPRPGTERRFLFVLCCSPDFSQQMELAATGTTGSHQRISPGTALDIRAPIPLDEAEQTAIATVLSDMDADLAALEARLAKTRALKQGMMQELLTGRTRLV